MGTLGVVTPDKGPLLGTPTASPPPPMASPPPPLQFPMTLPNGIAVGPPPPPPPAYYTSPDQFQVRAAYLHVASMHVVAACIPWKLHGISVYASCTSVRAGSQVLHLHLFWPVRLCHPAVRRLCHLPLLPALALRQPTQPGARDPGVRVWQLQPSWSCTAHHLETAYLAGFIGKSK